MSTRGEGQRGQVTLKSTGSSRGQGLSSGNGSVVSSNSGNKLGFSSHIEVLSMGAALELLNVDSLLQLPGAEAARTLKGSSLAKWSWQLSVPFPNIPQPGSAGREPQWLLASFIKTCYQV